MEELKGDLIEAQIQHFLEMERYEQVIELTKEALNDDPENHYFLYILGYSSYQLCLFNDAEYQLLEAMRLGFDDADIYLLLGCVYLEQRRWQESEEMLLEGLRLNPNSAEIHAWYAYLMKKLGHKTKAKILIKKAMELEPESPTVLRMHYRLEGVNSKHKEQIFALEQYMNSSDSELNKLIHLGINATYREKVKEAREYFRQAFLQKPEDQGLLNILKELEIESHPLLAVNRWIERLGGPTIIWMLGVGIGGLLMSLGLETIGKGWIICYVAVALYTWFAEPLVKMIHKYKG